MALAVLRGLTSLATSSMETTMSRPLVNRLLITVRFCLTHVGPV